MRGSTPVILAFAVYGLGCLDAIADGAARPTFARDVAPLLQRYCQDCHRPGQAAPMSLLTYVEVRPWAKAIEQVVTAREMPPFHAAGPIGRYVDDPRLTDEEIALIARWVESGAPRGDVADLPPPKSWDDSVWLGGEPDLIVTLPRFEIRSDGIDDNVDLYSEFVFPEDLWLRAVEVRPSSKQRLHHANVFLTMEDETIPDSLIAREMNPNLLIHPFLLQWLPGRSLESMPEGEAIRIPAGRRIMLNAHYAPTTEPHVDEPMVGLYFADGTVSTVQQNMAFMGLGRLKPIAPNDDNYTHTFRKEFATDALVTEFQFHMHYRGCAASVVFARPDGTIVPGIEVPRYNFNWQRQYNLVEPIAVPRGTKALVTLRWDNSAANPLNPDPSAEVRFGLLTTNEMAAAGIGYYDSDSILEEPITVRNGRRVDSPQHVE